MLIIFRRIIFPDSEYNLQWMNNALRISVYYTFFHNVPCHKADVVNIRGTFDQYEKSVRATKTQI